MDTIIYVDQENGRVNTPAIKSHQRLQSVSDKCVRTPLAGKLNVPVSGRKALGTVNKIIATPSLVQKGGTKAKPVEAQQCKAPLQKTKDYPEIEKIFPYNPNEFETYGVPNEVCLSRLSLAGLALPPWHQCLPEERVDIMDVCLPPSPVKSPSEDYTAELDAFLQTISELTVDLPPECEC